MRIGWRWDSLERERKGLEGLSHHFTIDVHEVHPVKKF